MRTDAARNRARILEAARTLIGEQWPDVSMDAIAAAAGVAVGTLYRHHPTKADLVSAVIEDSLGRFADQVEASAAAAASGADAFATLAAVVRAFAEQHTRDRALKAAASLLGRPMPLDVDRYPADSAARRAGAAVARLVDAAREAGAVRADLGLADLTMLLDGIPDDPERRDRYVDIVLRGIAADPR